jgi:hypothetical protein
LRHLSFIGLVAALGAILVSGVSCKDDTVFRSLCASDQECIAEHDGNPNWACEKAIGDCVCTGDLACVGEDEHCETYPGGDGRCHPNESCEWNEDCEGNTFCDVQDRHCRLTGCTDDLQCDLGELCDGISRTCTPGCWSHGDCSLGDVCMCQDTAGNPTPCPPCEGPDRTACGMGQCVADTCADKSFCRYGDLCVEPPEGSTDLATCESAITDKKPFCSNCQASAGEVNRCGSLGPNFCLIDTSDPAGRASFCGVDCRDGQECPNGLSCRDVLILTEATCRGDAQCAPRPNAPDCTTDDECPAGARCEGGRCAGRCAVGEGGQAGFCTCVQDDDCPQQSCGSDSRCTITREPCTPGADDQCRGQIFCVNNGELGYCQIGRNCAPDEGISCSDVRCDQDPSGCGL